MAEPLLQYVIDACREFLAARVQSDPADDLAYGRDNSHCVALPQAVAFANTHEEIAAPIHICA